MASDYFYRAIALMLTVGALSKIQRLERKGQARSEKLGKLIEYHEKRDKAIHQHRICYYRAERNDSHRLQPEGIDPKLCSHVIVGFAEVRYDFLLPKIFQDLDCFNRTVALKKKNADLKVLLSVGARSKGSLSHTVATNLGREKLIFSLLHFLDKHKFDGIDFDWEFPAWNGASAYERIYFVLLLKELRHVIDKQKKKYLISCAVAAHLAIIDTSYDIPALAKYVDFVNLMSYDFRIYNPDYPLTAHHSALYSRNSEKETSYYLNAAWAALFWEARGMPRKKIMVGIPTHARTYRLKDANLNGLDMPASGPGLGKGLLTYPQVCNFLKTGAIQKFDISTKVPYAFLGRDWVAYDNKHSVSFKSQWVKEEGFGGVVLYNLNNDDWAGRCDNATKFPLAKAVAKMMVA